MYQAALPPRLQCRDSFFFSLSFWFLLPAQPLACSLLPTFLFFKSAFPRSFLGQVSLSCAWSHLSRLSLWHFLSAQFLHLILSLLIPSIVSRSSRPFVLVLHLSLQQRYISHGLYDNFLCRFGADGSCSVYKPVSTHWTHEATLFWIRKSQKKCGQRSKEATEKSRHGATALG